MKKKFLVLSLILTLAGSFLVGCNTSTIQSSEDTNLSSNEITSEMDENENTHKHKNNKETIKEHIEEQKNIKEIKNEEALIEEEDMVAKYTTFFEDYEMPNNNIEMLIKVTSNLDNTTFPMSISVVDDNFALFMEGNNSALSTYIIDDMLYVGSVVDGLENWVCAPSTNSENGVNQEDLTNEYTPMIDIENIINISYLGAEVVDDTVMDIVEVTVANKDEEITYTQSENGAVAGILEGSSYILNDEENSTIENKENIDNFSLIYKFYINQKTQEIHSVEYDDFKLTKEGLLEAKLDRRDLEGTVIMCDAYHNLLVDLKVMRGVIPRSDGAVGIADGSTRDIALISRVGKKVCFTVEEITLDQNGKEYAFPG